MSPDEERRALLAGTLANAALAPYYRKAWGNRWRRVRAPEDLVLLPFLTKQQARERQAQLLVGPAPAYAGVVSSGTTQGEDPPLRVLRTAAEADALEADRVSEGEARSPRPRRPKAKDLVLEVRTVHHGLPDAPPGDDRIAVPWTDTRSGLKLIEQLLERRQPDGRRVTAMAIGAAPLMVLTAHFLERGRSPARFRLKAIGTYGFRLAGYWREWLGGAWRAPLFDNFSLSEFTTSAMECAACGFHHWDRPPLLPEVVDPFTRRPLRRGCGVLVLTSLFPFSQAMPLIRYWTGDLVERGPQCRAADDWGFRYRGREATSLLRKGRDPVLLSGVEAQELLADRPEVARVPHAASVLGLIRSQVGPAKITMVPPRTVRVELSFEPVLFPRRAEEIARLLRRPGLTVQLAGPAG